MHVRITDIDLTFGDHRHKELVGYYAVDAVHDGEPGEYPLLIPIDLESRDRDQPRAVRRAEEAGRHRADQDDGGPRARLGSPARG